MQTLQNLPWYIYPMLGIMLISFFIIKILPLLKEAKRVLTTGDFIKNPDGPTLSEQQFRALSVGAINGEQTSAYIDSLTTGMDNDRLNKGLNEYWGVYDASSAHQTLEWLKVAGHRYYFNDVYTWVTQQPKEHWVKLVEEKYQGEEANKVYNYTTNLAETMEGLKTADKMTDADFERGILAWDMGRMITVARMCYDKKFIDEATAFQYINVAHETTQQQFSSWKELGDSYIIGRSMWSGDDMMLDGLKSIKDSLLTEEKSPWKMVSF